MLLMIEMGVRSSIIVLAENLLVLSTKEDWRNMQSYVETKVKFFWHYLAKSFSLIRLHTRLIGRKGGLLENLLSIERFEAAVDALIAGYSIRSEIR